LIVNRVAQHDSEQNTKQNVNMAWTDAPTLII